VRYLLGAVLALGLITNSSGIASADSTAGSPGPAMIPSYLGTQAAFIYAQATRLASDMNQLYHVTRLDELKLAPISTPVSASTSSLILCKDSAPVGTPGKSRT
jgi:hypothetical protein